MIEMVIFSAAMAFAIALVFLIPSREVTRPPGRGYWVVEVLFPGTHPSWGIFGGLAFVAWTCWLVYLAGYRNTLGNAAVITTIATPGLQNYGIPFDEPWVVWWMFRPNWILVFAVPPLLFAVNLVLVFRDKLFRRNS